MDENKSVHRILNTNFNIYPDTIISVMNNEKWSKSYLDNFTVKFNGKAVESNEMDAEELATSLLGISTILEESNIILNGQYSKMLVKVRSSFRPGSFIVDIATFSTSEGITAFVNIGSIIGFIGGGGGYTYWVFPKNQRRKNSYKKTNSRK